MTIVGAALLRHDLPDELAFPYFDDRESPWLLARCMPEHAVLRALKTGPLARYLERPMVKPVVAACGGTLRRADVRAVADADGGANAPDTTAALAGLLASFDLPWHDFALSFDAWGEDDGRGGQTSRNKSNLVIQLGFPSDHAVLMGRYLKSGARKAFEYDAHPVRKTGRPTLAWARVDVEDGVALIEEVQSDWLRIVRSGVLRLEQMGNRRKKLNRLLAYEAGLRERYLAIWPRAMLLATISVLHEELGINEIFMHQPAAGIVLKGIYGGQPPVSLYSALPKRFGFQPTREAPPFLHKPRRRLLKKLRRRPDPLFWHLAF